MAIERTYDDAGRLHSVRSRSSESGNPVVNEVEFAYTPLWQAERLWQNATGPVTYDGSGDPTGTTRLVKQTYTTVPVNASGASVNHSRLIELAYPRNVNSGSPVTSTLVYDYGSSSSVDSVISRVTGLTLDSTEIVEYGHVGVGLVTHVDYVVPDIQLDRTLSADGGRRTGSYTTQAAGVYPVNSRPKLTHYRASRTDPP